MLRYVVDSRNLGVTSSRVIVKSKTVSPLPPPPRFLPASPPPPHPHPFPAFPLQMRRTGRMSPIHSGSAANRFYADKKPIYAVCGTRENATCHEQWEWTGTVWRFNIPLLPNWLLEMLSGLCHWLLTVSHQSTVDCRYVFRFWWFVLSHSYCLLNTRRRLLFCNVSSTYISLIIRY